MKTTEFMDKQIMELSQSHSEDFSQLSYLQQFNNDDDDSISSCQLRPARQSGSSMDYLNLAKSGSKYVVQAYEDSTLISVIERKMNQHFGNLLHAVEGLSAQIS
ncbi:hypothetical protein ACFX13_034018 [Malus domestica]|uniref:Uncharacterized protein n=1 Tax=Malus domestica TaxID=3750 RepID=A0A498K649_MALDO|nr:hypothetical protein DVH24_015093 [Malus domestica]